jgi:hypothetical protein
LISKCLSREVLIQREREREREREKERETWTEREREKDKWRELTVNRVLDDSIYPG